MSLLREMTYQDKGSYESSPPCRLSLMEYSVVFSLQMFIVILYEVFTIVYDTLHNVDYLLWSKKKQHQSIKMEKLIVKYHV